MPYADTFSFKWHKVKVWQTDTVYFMASLQLFINLLSKTVLILVKYLIFHVYRIYAVHVCVY